MDYKKQFMDQIMTEMAQALDENSKEMLEKVLLKKLQNVDVQKAETQIACLDDDNERYMRLFAASRRLEGMSERTIRQYLFYSKRFFDVIHKNFADITTTDVQYYLAEYDRTHNITKRSLENIRKGINGFFLWLTENEYIPKNPISRIKPIAYDKKTVEILSDDDVFNIRNTVFGDLRTRAIVELLLATGVRVSELISIRIDDIDFERSEITIHSAKKRRKMDRLLFLTADAKATIRAYINYRWERGYTSSPYLFVANRKGGKPLTERLVNGKLKDIEVAAGLSKRLTVHTFRKTLASILYRRGMQPLDIAYILGHEDSRMSETYYISVQNEDVKRNYGRYR